MHIHMLEDIFYWIELMHVVVYFATIIDLYVNMWSDYISPITLWDVVDMQWKVVCISNHV